MGWGEDTNKQEGVVIYPIRNPRFGYGVITQTSPVDTVNRRLPIKGTDVGRGPSIERTYQTQNHFFPAQVTLDNASGRTLNQQRNTRPLINAQNYGQPHYVGK